MPRNNFLVQLERFLKGVPEQDRRDMLYDFEEHFDIGIAEGKSEQELVRELGDPRQIAKDMLADYHISKAESEKSVPNMTRALIAMISLSFFNIMFILGPVVGIVGVYIGLCVTTLALLLTPLVIVASLIFNGFQGIILVFFISITLCSLGILLGVGMIHLGKMLYNLILGYIKLNLRIIKGDQAL